MIRQVSFLPRFRPGDHRKAGTVELEGCPEPGAKGELIVNGVPIGDHFRGDDAPLRAGENKVIAGGVDSQFVFSVFID
jgi:hypothetical protein